MTRAEDEDDDGEDEDKGEGGGSEIATLKKSCMTDCTLVHGRLLRVCRTLASPQKYTSVFCTFLVAL